MRKLLNFPKKAKLKGQHVWQDAQLVITLVDEQFVNIVNNSEGNFCEKFSEPVLAFVADRCPKSLDLCMQKN